VLFPTTQVVSMSIGKRQGWKFEETMPGQMRTWPAWHDGVPEHRLELPKFSAADRERMVAGSPSPVKLSAWKEKVLMLLAYLHMDGKVWRGQVTSLGLDPQSFCAEVGNSYLKPSPNAKSFNGQCWVLNENGGLPRLDLQFPHTFSEILAALKTRRDNGSVLKVPGLPEPPQYDETDVIIKPTIKLQLPRRIDMSDNTITELRSVLFETMRGVKDGSIDIGKGKTVADLAGRIIDTAKAETEFVRTFGRNAVPTSGFIGAEKKRADTLDTQANVTKAEPGTVHYTSLPKGPQASL
jgi:hypothetical protein